MDPKLHTDWPPEGQYLWEIYARLGRPASLGGFSRISQAEIAAWQSNHRTRLSVWELGVLAAFDDVASEIANQPKAPKPT